jgi:thiosulfate/3-mercaptopyruvate sulfurtransferase
MGYELPGPLVSPEWLVEALRDGGPRLVLADVRWYPNRDAREAYEEGHIPGAVFLDAERDLAGPVVADSGRHPLPSPEAFAEAMSRVGIGEESEVVAYDDTGGANAARLWWMLSVGGHPAAVMDGGLAAWPGDVEAGPPPTRRRARFSPYPWPEERVADHAEVGRLRRSPSAVVIDARAAERYRAEAEPIDPVAGHIPGARNAPWTENLDPATGRFLAPQELRSRYAEVGADGARQAVVHCGSGITACHDILAMEVAGLPPARLYVASWSGWIADPSRPVARGPEP